MESEKIVGSPHRRGSLSGIFSTINWLVGVMNKGMVELKMTFHFWSGTEKKVSNALLSTNQAYSKLGSPPGSENVIFSRYNYIWVLSGYRT